MKKIISFSTLIVTIFTHTHNPPLPPENMNVFITYQKETPICLPSKEKTFLNKLIEGLFTGRDIDNDDNIIIEQDNGSSFSLPITSITSIKVLPPTNPYVHIWYQKATAVYHPTHTIFLNMQMEGVFLGRTHDSIILEQDRGLAKPFRLSLPIKNITAIEFLQQDYTD